MRDHNIEVMTQTAQSCADGGNATASIVKAIRMCFDVLEFMKLVSILYRSIASQR
jgi:hypothetical protein